MKKTHPGTSRREFLLQSTLAAPAALLAGASTAHAQPQDKPAAEPLPRRKLGRNGPEVTILNIGGMMAAHSADYLDLAWSLGIRYFDTAKVYIKGQSEKNVAQWIARHPERRKELFLVSKYASPGGYAELLQNIDERLEACGTDYLDLLFLHGIGPKKHGQDSLNWPKDPGFAKVIEQIKATGKAKMVGFSCHDDLLNDYLAAAAEGGFVDAIMLQYNPFFTKGDAFDKALDACHAKGIGLIAMKTMRSFKELPEKMPEFEKLGLNTRQVLLQAVWTDERMASLCSMIDNVQIMEDNVAAARKYTAPLDRAQLAALREAATMTRVAMCPGCPACRQAARETPFAFSDISRYVAYYEQEGNTDARQWFQELDPAARNTAGTDLARLRDACAFHVDYPEIARRAGRYFA